MREKWPTPTNVTEVWCFWGFMGYYRWFILKLMQVVWPLHELTSSENAGKKKVAIAWDDKCQWSFDDLKCLCTTVPILAYAISQSLSSSIPALVGLAWGLSSTRLMTMVLMPSLPMLVGVWQRLNPTTPPKLQFLTLKWAMVKKFHE